MSIRAKLLIISSMCLLIGFLSFIYQETHSQKKMITLNIEKLLQTINDDFYQHLDHEIQALSAVRDIFVHNDIIKDLYIRKDRQKLYEYAYPIFDDLRKKYAVTNVYFHLPDGKTFLRLNDKDTYDDYTKRVTFRIAQATKGNSEGLELEKCSLAVRVISPFYNNGELIGYIEFGEEINHFLAELKKKHPLVKNMLIAFAKDFLNREDWIPECPVHGKSESWDAFKDYAVAGALQSNFDSIKPFIDKKHMDFIDRSSILFATTYNTAKPNGIGGFPLRRVDDKIVGAVLCDLDISPYIEIRQANLHNQIISFLFIMMLFLIVVYFIVDHSLIKPLLDLGHTAQQIAAEGDLSARSSIESNDEIGVLAVAFNKMTDDLSSKTVSKRYLDEIFQSMVDPLLVIDTRGIVTTTNKATCELLEFSEDMIIGQHISRIIEDDRTVALIMKLPQTENINRMTAQCAYTSLNGELIPMFISFSTLSNKENVPIGVIINGKDMTELTRTEALLHEEKEFLQKVIDAIPAPIFFKGTDGIYIGCNTAFEKCMGHPKEKIIGHTVYDVVSGETADRFNKMDDSMFAHPQIQIFEESFRYADGSVHDVVFHKAPYFYGDRKLAGLVGAILDITQIKQIERELQKFKALSDNANYGVAILDTGGCIQYINNYMAGVHGYTVDSLTGRNIRIFYTSQQYEEFLKIHDKLLQQGSVSIDEIWHTASDDRAFPMLVKCVLIKNDLGEPIFITMTAIDISEQLKMKEELLKAVKLESIGLLAGGIGHDFNNLLTAILGNAAIAQMDIPPDNPVFELLVNIENASKRAKDLSQQLLTFSKGGSPVKETASIETIIKDCTAFTLKGSNVKCEFDFADQINAVNVDKGQISQVINNMVVNAVHAMPGGGVITLSCRNETITTKTHQLPPGNYVRISIKDQGVGIDPNNLNKIFDPYFTTKEHGNGLGLATSYSIIKKHDGHITVDSAPGKGTCFTIYIPVNNAEHSGSQKKKEAIFQGHGKILIMDDEDIVRQTIGQLVERLGYEISYAEDGQSAIEIYRREYEKGTPFAAVIMDLTIPGGMGGKDAIGELRKIDPQVCAVVASGYCNDPVMSNHQEYGFRAVVKKPVSIHDLSSSLHEALESAKKA